MLNEYKERKFDEFIKQQNMFTMGKEGMRLISIDEIKQFISDLIDEVERAIPKTKDETYIINCINCKDDNAII